MADLLTKIRITLEDRLSGPGRAIGAALERLTQTTSRLGDESTSAGLGLDRLTAPRNLSGTADQVEAVAEAMQDLQSETGQAADAQLEHERGLGRLEDRLDGAGMATDRLTRETRQLGQEAGQATRNVNALSDASARMDAARRLRESRMNTVAGLSAAGNELTGMGRALLQPVGDSLSASGMFEDFEVQFQVLLGSTELAKSRLAELARFAGSTPFDLPGVVRASTTLETLTKGALATGAGLRMVGDVAAGTGSQIDELAIWFGRLYDGVMSGRPPGEALARLQELGAISGDARSQIEEMVASGADGAQIWREIERSFSRYAGMMEEKSKTLNGQLSNMSDSWTRAKAALGNTFVPYATRAAGLISGLADRLEILAKEHPGLTRLFGGLVIGLGVTAVAAGTLLKIGAGLLGMFAMASFGLQAMNIQLGSATLGMRTLGLASTTTSVSLARLSFASVVTGIRSGIAALSGLIPMLWTTASAAIPAMIGGLQALWVAIASIPFVGWIAAIVSILGLLIYKFWPQISAFFAGVGEGFASAFAPVGEIFAEFGTALAPLGSAFNWVGQQLAKLFGQTTEGVDGARKWGQAFGLVLGWVARLTMWPLGLMQAFGTLIGEVVAMLMGLIQPMQVVDNLAARLGKFFGFSGEMKLSGGNDSSGIAEPALAKAGSGFGTDNIVPFATPSVPAPVNDRPVPVLQPAGGSSYNFNQPITIYATPGMDEAAIARQVREQVEKATQEAAQRLERSRRGSMTNAA